VTELKVWPIDDGCYLVRGTDDPALAQAALRDFLVAEEGEYLIFDPLTANAEAQTLIDRLQLRVDWYRCNPCTCGDEHSFDMMEVSGPARGNFVGVFFT
jgi:hypothetical protein